MRSRQASLQVAVFLVGADWPVKISVNSMLLAQYKVIDCIGLEKERKMTKRLKKDIEERDVKCSCIAEFLPTIRLETFSIQD